MARQVSKPKPVISPPWREAYNEHGLTVIPVPARKKSPVIKWKAFQDRRPTEEEIRVWEAKGLFANWAIVLGHNGLHCIDIDDPVLMRRVAPTLYKALTDGGYPRIRTAHGVRAYMRSTTPAPNKNYKDTWGFEIHGHGRVSIGWGSLHPDGPMYQLETPGWFEPPHMGNLFTMVRALLGRDGVKLERPTNVPRYKSSGADVEGLGEGVGKGQRDEAAMKLLGHWVASGITDWKLLYAKLMSWNQSNKPPIGDAPGDPDPQQWAKAKVTSVLTMEARNHPERLFGVFGDIGPPPDDAVPAKGLSKPQLDPRIQQALQEYLLKPSVQLAQVKTFGDYENIKPISYISPVIQAYPGGGKSVGAALAADKLWRKHELPVLYAALQTRDDEAFRDFLGRLETDGSGWNHWRGHEKSCERGKLAQKGYFGGGHCTCGREVEFTSARPAFAAPEYLLEDLTATNPLANKVLEFKAWILDEVDFARLTGSLDVPLADVRVVSKHHPSPPIRRLTKAMADTLAEMKDGDKPITGPDLYAHIGERLGRIRGHVRHLFSAGEQRRRNVLRSRLPLQRRNNPPPNFPPALVHVMQYELGRVVQKQDFNPRIHLLFEKGKPVLRLRWRKSFVVERVQLEGGRWWNTGGRPPIIVLDATAKPDVLQQMGILTEHVVVEPPPWPDNVKVHQVQNITVTKSTLGLYPPSQVNAADNRATRKRWYDRIIRDLLAKGLSANTAIGLVTFKEIETEAKGALRSAGFKSLETLHYHGQRSHNSLRDVDVLILLGCPIPPPDAFREEAQAYFYDGPPLPKLIHERRKSNLLMVDGQSVESECSVYSGDPRIDSYFQVKCQDELYHALHRMRPYNPTGALRHAFIYTGVPIEGVEVTGLLRDAKQEELERWRDTAVQALQEALAAGGGISVPELAAKTATPKESKRTIEKRIQRGAYALAALVGCRFEPGKGGRAGLFATRV